MMARGVLVGVLIPGDRYGSRIGLVAYLLKTRVLCVCVCVFFLTYCYSPTQVVLMSN